MEQDSANPVLEKWYRYQDSLTTDGPSVHFFEFYVIRKTKRGVWLDVWGRDKFVLTDAKKRWACPSKEEAMVSFIARKKRQLKIHKAVVERIETILRDLDGEKKFLDEEGDSSLH